MRIILALAILSALLAMYLYARAVAAELEPLTRDDLGNWEHDD